MNKSYYKSGKAAEPSRALDGGNKRLIITGTNKGGTGKTFFLLQLWDWFAARRTRVAALDCDWHNATLTRFVPESVFLELAQSDAAETMREVMASSDVILMDGPGAQYPHFWEWMTDCGLFDPGGGHNNVSVTVVLTIEEDKDTVFQAAQVSEAMGSSVQWLVVQNLKTSQSTSIYEASATREQLLKLGAEHIVLDRLPWTALGRMQKSSVTLSGLLEVDTITPLERERLKSYQQRLFQELDRVEKILLPEPGGGYQTNKGLISRGRLHPRIAPEEV